MQQIILILVLVLGGLVQTLNASASPNYTPISKVAGHGVYGLREDAKKRYEDDKKQIEAPPDGPLANFNVLNFFIQRVILIFAYN